MCGSEKGKLEECPKKHCSICLNCIKKIHESNEACPINDAEQLIFACPICKEKHNYSNDLPDLYGANLIKLKEINKIKGIVVKEQKPPEKVDDEKNKGIQGFCFKNDPANPCPTVGYLEKTHKDGLATCKFFICRNHIAEGLKYYEDENQCGCGEIPDAEKLESITIHKTIIEKPMMYFAQ